MKITRTETDLVFSASSHVPTVVIVLEAEARPVVYMGGDAEAMRRVALGLSTEWQELLADLSEAAEFVAVVPATDQSGKS